MMLQWWVLPRPPTMVTGCLLWWLIEKQKDYAINVVFHMLEVTDVLKLFSSTLFKSYGSRCKYLKANMSLNLPKSCIPCVCLKLQWGSSCSQNYTIPRHIQGMYLLVLLDSGSSHSFLRTQVAAHVQGLSTLPKKLSVQVADGYRIDCTQQLVKVLGLSQVMNFSPTYRFCLFVPTTW